MSEVIYESLQRVTKRKVYLIEKDTHETEPLFLGSKYIGQEIIIAGVVKGSDYADAKAGIEQLEKECKEKEEKAVLNITGKIVSVMTELKMDSHYQPFTLTLKIY